jgi:hypothetical protein
MKLTLIFRIFEMNQEIKGNGKVSFAYGILNDLCVGPS